MIRSQVRSPHYDEDVRMSCHFFWSEAGSNSDGGLWNNLAWSPPRLRHSKRGQWNTELIYLSCRVVVVDWRHGLITFLYPALMMGISQSESKSCLDSWDVAFCIAIVVAYFFEAKINCTEAMGPTLMIWDLSCYCFTRPWLGTAGLFDSHVLSSSCHGRTSCWDIGATGSRRFWGWGWAVPTGRVPCLRSEVPSSRRGLLANISKSYHIIDELMNLISLSNIINQDWL